MQQPRRRSLCGAFWQQAGPERERRAYLRFAAVLAACKRELLMSRRRQISRLEAAAFAAVPHAESPVGRGSSHAPHMGFVGRPGAALATPAPSHVAELDSARPRRPIRWRGRHACGSVSR